MKTVDFIRAGLETSQAFTLALIEDMKDAPLTAPTGKGGNHPLWILGHLAYNESNIINHVVQGQANPLVEWKEIFGGGTEAVTDASHYPPFEELMQRFREVRAETVKFLDSLSPEDLNQSTVNCPPGREVLFGTVGSSFLALIIHPTMHRGQVADARRMAGRKPLFA